MEHNDFPVIREEFSQDENIILYSMHGLEELAVRIKAILGDTLKGENLAHNGFLCAQENHTWAKNAEAILKITGIEK